MHLQSDVYYDALLYVVFYLQTYSSKLRLASFILTPKNILIES